MLHFLKRAPPNHMHVATILRFFTTLFLFPRFRLFHNAKELCTRDPCKVFGCHSFAKSAATTGCCNMIVKAGYAHVIKQRTNHCATDESVTASVQGAINVPTV